ncbi:MAG: DNA polymerase III subunit alpha [Limnochordales bacterium]|nr:DNA polymerase III subunit alpha [Limnochordales bacterium]
MSFVHLHVHSPYSFLSATAALEELVAKAAALGMPALALTDRMNVSGALAFHKLACAAGLKPIQGVELVVPCLFPQFAPHHCCSPDQPQATAILILLAQNPRGYANICRLLTLAYQNSPRQNPCLPRFALPDRVPELWEDVIVLSGGREGEISRLLLAGRREEAATVARLFQENLALFYLELENRLLPRSIWLNQALVELGEYLHLPVVATNPVHQLERADFPLYDVLTCVRTGTTLEEVHPARPLNGESYFKSAEEMAALFAQHPRALAATLEIAARCQPALDLSRPRFPSFPLPPGEISAAAFLRRLVEAGARQRYGELTPPLAARIEHELNVITRLGVEDYFLVVWDLVQFARTRGIRLAGRGSAADSVVAYCLGLTEVDAFKRGLLFERFLSLERAQKPDIDIDFAAEHRDRVAAYVYEKYGREHVASVCTFSTYHARSALREIGKVLGFPEAEMDRLAKKFPHIPADAIEKAVATLPEIRDSHFPLERYQLLFRLAARVAGFPRFIGTHLGGLVISRDPITEISPLQVAAKGVEIIQFDKDAVEDLGLIKLDLLSLRTLSALDQAVQTVRQVSPAFSEAEIPDEDPATYRRIRRGETVGMFQLESPAQRALQARLGADHFEDLVASVALIRPGPIKGDMVEPFLARRHGREPVTYLLPELEPILAKTYGVVLYQEQVIAVATRVAGFTPGEADRLRRVMTHYRSQKEMDAIGEEFIARAIARGIDPQIARTIFSYIVGYAGYGFCEAHAAAFANTAYKTAYLLEHYPAAFYAALFSCQPMGFYPPHALAVEAARRGIKILNPDVNKSDGWRFTVEDEHTIRPSLFQVEGLKEAGVRKILAAREEGGSFRSFTDFVRRVDLPRDVLANLILAGAFDSLTPNPHRRALLFQLPDLLGARPEAAGTGQQLRLALEMPEEQAWPDFTPLEKSLREFAVLGFSPSGHPLSFYREQLRTLGIVTNEEVQARAEGERVRVAGLLIRPHRPPTRSGRVVVFFTLEDETGLLDLTAFAPVYQRYGKFLFGAPALVVTGRVQRRGARASVLAQEIAPLNLGSMPSPFLSSLPSPPP